MKTVLLLASLRYLTRHPWMLMLSVLGIGLGVAVVIAIDLTNRSALESFDEAAAMLSGQATHRIVGGPSGIDENVYVDLRINLGMREIAPVVEAYSTSQRYPGETFHILGSDGFARTPFRFDSEINETDAMTKLLTQPQSILLFENTAKRFDLNVGDHIPMTANGLIHDLTIVGLIPVSDQWRSEFLENIVIVDIATAQELFGVVGYLSRIELSFAEHDDALINKVVSRLPQGVQLIVLDQEQGGIAQLTEAFRTNLRAMSLLALLVGVFIIYNSISFSVIQRRKLFATLRAIGVTGAEIGRLILVEVLLLGLVGAVLGIVLAIILSHFLLALVTQTMSDLYSQGGGAVLSIDSLLFVKGIVLGLSASLVAAALPALEAVRTPARIAMQHSALEKKTQHLLPRLVLLGCVFLAASLLIIIVFKQSLNLSFVALFLWVLGYVLLVPWCVSAIVRQLHRYLSQSIGLIAAMVFQGLYRNLSRTGMALAAIVVAVATTLGVTTMVGSFRVSVADWIDHSLRADVYVSMPSHHDYVKLSSLDEGLIQQLTALSGVEAISLGRRAHVYIGERPVELLAFDLPEQGFAGFDLITGDWHKAWKSFRNNEQVVLVSEPYAYRYNASVGDQIELVSPTGKQVFKVLGVYRDYGSEQGVIAMPRTVYRQYWLDQGVDTIGLYSRDDERAAEDKLLNNIRSVLPLDTPLLVRSKSAIMEATITVFNRTFAITDVLRLLTLFVAGVGILSALMVLQLERGREFAILRATGMTSSQIRVLLFAETSVLGLLAGMLALPLGMSLAYMLVHVINKRSFGWSMSLELDISQIMAALLLAVVSAVVAAVYPAYRMRRSSPSLVLRGE